MKLELISFKLCPFAQRAIIALNSQNHDFKVSYINPMDPPDWFKAISPTGQVPLLKVDDQVVFESSVIAEFINDISTTDIHPKDVIQKANNRSWIAFSGDMLGDMFGIVTGDEEKFNTAKKALFGKLAKIESVKDSKTFFNGDEFNMIDAAFAPIFMRLSWINEFTDNALSLAEFKNLNAWSDAVLALDVVKNSVVDGLEDVYYSNIEGREGHLSTLLVEEDY
ncbi:glutathione S-transferase family protein [Candidatus Thioglobus autotrophicus]|uniref:glutathione S-transferase family protein n=1 Tax=Candidatus Thioglobus autotrophicus TaxID=1705394 RepID=UPI00299EF221|nr:glutathione S-transferase family protein [Candidatus Thioglobus autotrophicus]WPE16119.1 glutathione S-transferase family protein [Candidatus Thioglobus autotrophicus]